VFDLTEEQRMIQDTAREFARKEVLPKAARTGREQPLPGRADPPDGRARLHGIAVPEEYGGAGMDNVCYAIAMEEISRACASTGVIMSVNNSLACDPILKFGSEEIKREYLVPMASGKKLGCFGLTEPGAGSDAGSQKTTAVRDGDFYIVDGTKNFITNAPQADTCVLFTMTDKAKAHKGITAFVVDMKWKGVSLGKHEKKMGIRASATSSIVFEEVRVPAKNRLGNEGDGFKVAMNTLDGGRIGIAARRSGSPAPRSRTPSPTRRTGNSSARRSAISRRSSGCWRTSQPRSTPRACSPGGPAWMKDRKMRHSKESSMAKLYASEVAMRAAVKGVQIHGGYGYINEYPAERHFRDAKITEIYEGTSEIQRLVISAALLKG